MPSTPTSPSNPSPRANPEAPFTDGDRRPIIFFDGVCVFCNQGVDLLLVLDRDRRCRLAPLQGTTAQALLPPLPENPQDWSIVYLDDTGPTTLSTAILSIGLHLGGPWAILSRLALAIPAPWRDSLYRWVARNRYRWLGTRTTCRMPDRGRMDQFLP